MGYGGGVGKERCALMISVPTVQFIQWIASSLGSGRRAPSGCWPRYRHAPAQRAVRTPTIDSSLSTVIERDRGDELRHASSEVRSRLFLQASHRR